ncbi:hypothetical protein [Algibacter mikhailovii]|uniref:Uncharacterized protein n=1 Tax=Algibacter mikhailovii TaxID=425498 RepID=A0A918VB75_9FLAO|nr:hypothetical protein [Algibacter mikhailovii]GGZ86700.1 hypothetical protein GCM10007028_26000 [Algibacter mikhailovii]
MKKVVNLFIFNLIFSSLIYNCSNSNDNIADDNSEIVDDSSYLVMRWDGTLFEIGNNTATISTYGSIDGISSSFSVIYNAVVTTKSSIYIIDREFTAGDSSIIVYNRNTNLSTKTVLDLSNPSFGDFPVLTTLDWDENSESLIGIVASNGGYPESISHVIQIDPLSLKVTNLEINLGQKYIISTTLLNSKLFASSVKPSNYQFEDLIEIDLKDKTYKSLNFNLKNTITKLTSNPLNNLIFCYSLGTTGINPNPDLPLLGNSAEPFILNITNGEYKKLLPDTDTGILSRTSKPFYDESSGNNASFMFTRDFSGIMEYNSENSEITFIDGSNWDELKGVEKCILTSIRK